MTKAGRKAAGELSPASAAGAAGIRRCRPEESGEILAVVNDAAAAYRGVIPADLWHEPYMSAAELEAELGAGVDFWCVEEDGRPAAVMGLQRVRDVTLVRHAYVRTSRRRHGLGGRLLAALMAHTSGPVLVGTWAAATWAVSFYAKHGFRPVGTREKDRLLRAYWSIPARQVETSVVLADGRYLGSPSRGAFRG